MKKSLTIEALIFYIVLAFFLVIISQMVFDSAMNTVSKTYAERQCLLAKQSLETIRLIIQEVYTELIFLSKIPDIKTLDKNTLSKTLWTIYNAKSSSIASLSRMGPDGKLVSTVPFPELDGTDISSQEHIKKVLSTHNPVIGGPLNVVQGFKAMVIHVPIFEKDTIFVGTIAASFKFEFLIEQFIQPLMEDSGDVWISNQFGQLIYHNRFESSSKEIATTFSSSDKKVLNFLANPQTLDKGGFVYRDLNGKQHIFSFTTLEIVPDNKWTLGIDRMISSATGILIDLRNKFFGSMGIIMVFALIAVLSLISQTEKRTRAETLLKQLKENEKMREQIAKIYNASHTMLTSNEKIDILEKSTKLFAEIFSPPIVLCWEFNEEKIIKYYSIQDNIQSNYKGAFTLDQLLLGYTFPDVLMDEIDKEQWAKIPFEKISKEFPLINILIPDSKQSMKIKEYCLIRLGTSDRVYGVILSPYLEYPVEILQTFTTTISQTLYANDVLKKLQLSNTIYSDTLANIDTVIFLIDKNFNILSASRAFCKTFNTPDNYIGKKIFDIVPIFKELHHNLLYDKVIKTSYPIETDETYILRDGNRKFVRTKIIPVIKEYGSVDNILVIMQDFTESRLLEEKLRSTAEELAQKNRVLHQQNITDELTKLRNRRYFTSELPQIINEHKTGHRALSLFVTDIDNFKQLNDTYGHQVGDTVLSTIGQLIQTFLHEGDFAARYGGDEFIIVLADCGLKEAIDTAERLRRTIEKTMFPDLQGNRIVKITISIGVAILTDNILDANEILQRADRALYSAKNTGKNRVFVYNYS